MRIIDYSNYKNLEDFINNGINKKLFNDLKNHEIENIKKNMNDIYGDNVNDKRHIYSDIYMILQQIKHAKKYDKIKEISEVASQSFEFLKREDYNYNENSAIIMKLIKLLDHINLEIARSQVLSLEFIEPLQELSDKYKELEKEKNKIMEDIQNKEIDFLSKMGIFMSIFMLIVNNVSVYRNTATLTNDYSKIISLTLITNAIILSVVHLLLATINKKYYNIKIVLTIIFIMIVGIVIIG
ncbi:hypothetical protein [Caviibacter abscessus]|uniref:hypothetical protein n=1 Tax=Caviibacter abscessus TaxID=1766719 RepID=UPI0008399FA0|nr:hypothetical protein [Caviibacter abscessus]